MVDKEFQLCRVCKFNHNDGKGHKYSNRHKQKLRLFLSKALQKIKDVSFFLNNPARLRESEKHLNSFWCSFCEAKISEEDSIFICSNTIKHLASSSHIKALNKFWYESGADAGKKHLYAFQKTDINKWENACVSLSEPNTTNELLSSGTMNNIHSECSSSMKTSFEAFSVGPRVNQVFSASNPLPFSKDGIYNYGKVRDLCSGDYCDVNIHWRPSAQIALHTKSNNELEKGIHMAGHLTCIRKSSLNCDVGNVHSGAPPPWLKVIEKNGGDDYSLSTNRKKTKLRNPKRVGAAWAEKRRAEMEMERVGTRLFQVESKVDNEWLPNFGRVWQSGSRKETKREFSFEKHSLEPKSQLQKSKFLQPYISKRQRLEATQQLEQQWNSVEHQFLEHPSA